MNYFQRYFWAELQYLAVLIELVGAHVNRGEYSKEKCMLNLSTLEFICPESLLPYSF